MKEDNALGNNIARLRKKQVAEGGGPRERAVPSPASAVVRSGARS